MQDFIFFIDAIGSTTLLYAGAGLLTLFLLFWLGYRVIKSAVREGIRAAGLGPNPIRPHRPLSQQLDPKYDFVYTEPRQL